MVAALLLVNVIQARTLQAFSRRMLVGAAVNVMSTCWTVLVTLGVLAGFVSDSVLLRVSILVVAASQLLALIYVTVRPNSRD